MSDVEQVRQVLDSARVQAVEEGLIYQFRYEPGGRKYVLLPYELQTFTDQNANQANLDSSNSVNQPSRLASVLELSEDCQFYTPTSLTGETVAIERLSDPWLQMIDNGVLHRDVNWSDPILYSPDGSASDGSVVVSDESGRYVSLRIRGLTGVVTASRLGKLPELFGAAAE